MKIPVAARLARRFLVPAATFWLGGTAVASDLSYSFLEFGSLTTRSDFEGIQNTGSQSVRLDPGDGDGLMIAASLALGRRFYLSGSYRAAIVDTGAEVTSPLTTSLAEGSFDWTTGHTAFGAVIPVAERLDVIAELGYRTVHFDFGSFAGEDFDADDSGAEFAIGIRFNPHPNFELAFKGFTNGVGKSDLALGEFSRQAGVAGALRWYLFEDIGLGLEVRSGDIRTLNASIRFGFGELRAGD